MAGETDTSGVENGKGSETGSETGKSGSEETNAPAVTDFASLGTFLGTLSERIGAIEQRLPQGEQQQQQQQTTQPAGDKSTEKKEEETTPAALPEGIKYTHEQIKTCPNPTSLRTTTTS